METEICPVCHKPIYRGETVVIVAEREVHPACAPPPPTYTDNLTH